MKLNLSKSTEFKVGMLRKAYDIGGDLGINNFQI